MILLIPYINELLPTDGRLLRLAEFLGISSVKLPLSTRGTRYEDSFGASLGDQPACLVVNPIVIKQWLEGEIDSPKLASFFLSRFPHLIVHGLRPDPFDADLVAALSSGRIQSIQEIDGENATYSVAKDSGDVCGVFSGLSFGAAHRDNDHVLFCTEKDQAVRELISIGGRPFMALVREHGAQVIFLASKDVADLSGEAGDAPLLVHFSKLVPHVMALRFVFGDECWHPGDSYGSVTIDDPLLHKQYGFLSYEALHRVMKQHKFHSAIAFIPHNFRRSDPEVTQVFRENPARFSMCFHGNDHTRDEFASSDIVFLNTIIAIAENRMRLHTESTGLPCDKVMVFPQGHFSEEAMNALHANNFHAAVNSTPYAMKRQTHLTIDELIQPAILHYGGFPLFIRHSIEETQRHDIAFRLFFGQPILLCEHHEVGQRLGLLAEFASMVNSVAPELEWTNLATVVTRSFLSRRAIGGAIHVLAYANCVTISNKASRVERFIVEWRCFNARSSVEYVLKDGLPCYNFEADDVGCRIETKLFPNTSQTLSLALRNAHGSYGNLGLHYNAKAFLRRRLSEVRDNYLSRNPAMLALAKTLHGRF